MRLRALLIDALGTTVRLPAPWERVDRAAVAGIASERVESAFRVEMAHYAAHAQDAVDARTLAGLRAECAAILSRELGRAITVEAMMGAIAFEAYPDARPALAAARAAGLRIVCVSNWDFELDAVLARIGIAACFDGVLTSAAAGARKPDPAIFEQALALAGCDAADALHVGDSDDDVEGACAAGVEVLRIDRAGGAGDIASLAELAPRLSGAQPGGPISEHSRP